MTQSIATPKSNSRGQIFAVDLIIGLLLMAITITSVALFLPDPEPPFTQDVERLQLLMTEGVPAYWDNSSVILPGFISEGRFNVTKIETFENMSASSQRALLGIQSAFTITFTNISGPLPLCALCGGVPASYKDVLPVRRTGLLGTEIVTMEVVLYK